MTPLRVVISLHGIRTRGVWQKDLVPELARNGFVPYVLDYGYFGAFQLMRKGSLEDKVNWLTDEYDRIRMETGCKRPSVIAHSFGTLQVARMLEMHRHVVFDKIIFAASIVPMDFPWAQMLSESRAKWVVNDFGGKDIWPRIAARLVPNAGNSGAVGFTSQHRALRQVEHPHHKHSDYFSLGNFRHNWIPTLLLPKRKIVDDLHGLIGMLSRDLSIDRKLLRCFVFAEDPATECLRVVPGLYVGTITEAESRMAISMDAIGIEAAPTIAFKQMREVRQSQADLRELADSLGAGSPINRNVAWSISVPVPFGDDSSRAIGVLVVDALLDTLGESAGSTPSNMEAALARGAAAPDAPSPETADELKPQASGDELVQPAALALDASPVQPGVSLANELLTMDNVYEVIVRLGISLCNARNE